ncbi:MAG: 30S ribosomal protein S8e [Candidatus Diapherotrites archaeon]|nr:30S ribosomal protein S8e [Candidatus Diapherotrites archaeon]
MVEWRQKSKRTKTGAIRTSLRRAKKKASQKGGFFSECLVGKELEEKRVKKKKTGKIVKIKAKRAKYANVAGKDGKVQKVAIVEVKENLANKHYLRRNIATKNAVIETEIGKARVTSRPGQDGVVNAVLL